jgi:hypothetical protein
MITKIQAILSLIPNAEVNIREEQIEWLNPNIAPVTDEEINAEIVRLEAEYNAKEYQRLRAKEYPAISDQLDYIYHNGIDAWKADMIDPVKAKYPKGAPQ